MISQDPITTRFIEAFQWLKDQGKVRSARQFALGLETYPQSLNEILKGRREATLPMIRKITEVYHINCHFLLTGQGSIHRSDVSGVSRSPQSLIHYVKAHEFAAYAAALKHDTLQDHTWTNWTLPEEMVGQNIDLAIQCNHDGICPSLRKGEVLFIRTLPRDSWKASLSSQRAYLIALQDQLHVVCIANNDATGIYISPDDRILPDFIPFDQIKKVWVVLSKWSPFVKVGQADVSTDKMQDLMKEISAQKEALASIQHMIVQMSDSKTSAVTY